MGIRISGACALMLPVCLFAAEHAAEHHVAEHRDKWSRTFKIGAGQDRQLTIENITGNIKVTGDSGSEVRVTVHESWHSDSAEDLAKARADVKLATSQSGNMVRLYLDGPFRDKDHWREKNRWENEVHFRHDFEVLVPRDINLDLKTINGRELAVTNVNGEFNLHNINGSVTLTNATGWGTFKTINGSVKAVFDSNPSKPSKFETLNGSIDVTFRPDLNADLRLSTMHGEVYTDFEVVPLTTPVSSERFGEGRKYRINSRRSVRVGSGGTEHEFKTMNGSIKIRKDGK
ncbi:MAG: hypothetical protein H7039_07945 [Bryobacteraceae bacterium]|nr:hypothetical protein [Bryobacteraceae bacterium]